MSFLGVDIGQSRIKAQAFNEDANLIAKSYSGYKFILRDGNVELSPKKMWLCFKNVIQDISIKTKKDPIKSICFSFLGSAVLGLSKEGKPLTNFIIVGNRKIINHFKISIDKNLDKFKIYKINGLPLNPIYPLSKILWFLSENQFIGKIKRFLLMEDYFFYKLGCTPTLDFSIASITGLLDINKKDWSLKASKDLGIDLSFFSRLRRTGSLIGKINKKFGIELGLPRDVKILCGGFDQYMSAIGSGAIKNEISSESIGTVDCITNVIKKPEKLEDFFKNNYQIGVFPTGNKFAVLSYVNSAGSILEWFKKVFYSKYEISGSKSNFFKFVESKINRLRTKLLVLPHFAGSGTPLLDSISKGLILGLDLESTKEDIFLAILESICFELRINIELMDKLSEKTKEFRVTGGGAKSDVWLQLKANIFNKPIKRVKYQESGCFAGALFGMVESGNFNNINDAVSKIVTIERTFYPDCKNNSYYDNKYIIYKGIYKNNKNSLNAIHKIC